MTRVVIDTNIIISAYLWGGNPARVLSMCRDKKLLPLCTTDTIEELTRTFAKKKFITVFQQINSTPARCIADFQTLIEIVIPADNIPPNGGMI